jgi:transglutaminase superfamily protein
MTDLAIRAEAHACAFGIRIALRCMSIPRLVTLVSRLPRVQRPSSNVDECVRAAEEAAGRVAHRTCLFTALTAFALLARRGHPVRVLIGAARDHGLDAHAWVTVSDVPLTASTRAYEPLWASGIDSPRMT